MKHPHKHAAFIKAWADGAEIEVFMENYAPTWKSTANPMWDVNSVYRVKQDPVEYWKATYENMDVVKKEVANLKLTFCHETGELKSAQVLKND